MDRKLEYFEMIDKYLNNELTEPELSEFVLEMKHNPNLSEELKLHIELEQAIQENDIVMLRENMKKITHHQEITKNGNEYIFPDTFNFGLADELISSPNFNGTVAMDDIINFSHTIPKIHLYQHVIAAKENIHQFYKEQLEYDSLTDQELFSKDDDALFEDIKKAMTENDLLDLRANLKQIASSLPDHSYSIEEIDDFLLGQLNNENRIEFEDALNINASLAKDVQLFSEIDSASAEIDIMSLRASLIEIQKSELTSKYRIEEIEGYIYNEMSEQEMALFELELADNKELSSEVDLIKNIDLALQENDIIKLRNNLSNIAVTNLKEKQSERSISVRFMTGKISKLVVAASLIMLLGIASLMSRYSSPGNIYEKFYTRYETTGISRSSNAMNNQTLDLAMQKFNNKEYESALNLLQELISIDKNNTVGHFYSGISLQELGKFSNAIEEYQVVVNEKDNLFIEQAEWYIGLCYLQTKEDKKAIKQFKKIANSNGFYQQKAEAILRKIKNHL